MTAQHMLFLEDELDARESVVEGLERQFSRYHVDGASTCKEARRLVAKRRAEGDVTRVIIVDEDLKDKERGSDFLAYIHRIRPGVRKILLTARAERPDFAKAINTARVDRYIMKSEFLQNPNVLYKAIRGVLREREGPVQAAMTALLREAQKSGRGDQILLAAGRRPMTAAELLRQMTEGTRLGQAHLRGFAELIGHAMHNPRAFMRELEKTESVLRRTSKRRTTKKRNTRKPRAAANR